MVTRKRAELSVLIGDVLLMRLIKVLSKIIQINFATQAWINKCNLFSDILLPEGRKSQYKIFWYFSHMRKCFYQ